MVARLVGRTGVASCFAASTIDSSGFLKITLPSFMIHFPESLRAMTPWFARSAREAHRGMVWPFWRQPKQIRSLRKLWVRAGTVELDGEEAEVDEALGTLT